VRRRHAEWLTALAEEAQADMLAGGDAPAWLDRLEAEHDNVRAALAWSLQAGAADLALRLGASLRPLWEIRGHLAEGSRWLDGALAAAGERRPELRAKALGVAGTLAFRGPQLDRARDLFAERFRGLGERKRLAVVLANPRPRRRPAPRLRTAIAVTNEALALQREVGDAQRQATSLFNLATFALDSGDPDAARSWLRECFAVASRLGYKEVLAYALAVAARTFVLEGGRGRRRR
jgi:predicted ATPase